MSLNNPEILDVGDELRTFRGCVGMGLLDQLLDLFSLLSITLYLNISYD